MLFILRALIWVSSLVIGFLAIVALDKNGLQMQRGSFLWCTIMGMVFLNVLVINLPSISPNDMRNKLLRFLRATVWVLNVALVAVLAFAALVLKAFMVLLGAVPSLAVIAYLLISSRRAGVETILKGSNTLSKPVSILEQPLATADEYVAYKQSHPAEIEVFDKALRQLLVEKYGFREEYVAKQAFVIRAGTGVTLIDIASARGITPEMLANEFFNDFYFSPDANNPEIFARNVDTDEPLSPDHDYADWRHRYLGRTMGANSFTANDGVFAGWSLLRLAIFGVFTKCGLV